MNVLICTPGRLLQHMDETPYFDCSQLKVLVLDEADRILDMASLAPTLSWGVVYSPNSQGSLNLTTVMRAGVLNKPELNHHESARTSTDASLLCNSVQIGERSCSNA